MMNRSLLRLGGFLSITGFFSAAAAQESTPIANYVVGTATKATQAERLRRDASVAPGNISRVWANEGGDKVTRAELRATANPASVHNSV
jgi:hypothetical protein